MVYVSVGVSVGLCVSGFQSMSVLSMCQWISVYVSVGLCVSGCQSMLVLVCVSVDVSLC